MPVQVAKLSARLQEREEQLSEAQDCYAKLEALYQAEKADNATTLATALATKVCFTVSGLQPASNHLLSS